MLQLPDSIYVCGAKCVKEGVGEYVFVPYTKDR